MIRRHLTNALIPLLSAATLVACGGGGTSNSKTASVPDPVEVPGAPEEPGVATESWLFPVQGVPAGGTPIEIRGHGFSADTRIMVGGAECADVTVHSSDSLICTAPAHPPGSVVDVVVLNADQTEPMVVGRYTYREEGVTPFRILATNPLQGIYAQPFSTTLESVVAGFEFATVERSWLIDDTAYREGDSVSFAAGRHTITLLVEDASGASDAFSYVIIVGEPTDLSASASTATSGNEADAFILSPDKSISIVNTGFSPLVNPRFVGEGRPDYIDWTRYLKSLAGLHDLPLVASESSRVALLEAAWRDLSSSTSHICSPGREDEHIYDPVMLVRGYGYECCSNAARALAYLGSFLDIPARVRSTVQHEYPEFVVDGRMFILDPDLRVRFWNENQEPLTAWTTESAPESLQNVTRYFVETAAGGYYEVHQGDALPFSADPEDVFRGYYFNNIVGETIWGYQRAFSTPDYVVYPHEKLEFAQSSDYAPLQWMRSDGAPENGAYAPAVGKVLFRMLWAEAGPRTFESNSAGNKIIPLNPLPYPVQELTFYFSGAVNPDGLWVTAQGQEYRIGVFQDNTWTISAEELRVLRNVADLAAVIPETERLVAVDVGMQFNPRVFGPVNSPVALTYLDDSGTCRRRMHVDVGGAVREVVSGSAACDTRTRQRVQRSFALTAGSPDTSVVVDYGNSYQGTWGVAARTGMKAYAEILVPRTPGRPAAVRVMNDGLFADWEIIGSDAQLFAIDVAVSQWLLLPATDENSTQLRATLRETYETDRTYIAHLSLIEGHDVELFPPAEAE